MTTGVNAPLSFYTSLDSDAGIFIGVATKKFATIFFKAESDSKPFKNTLGATRTRKLVRENQSARAISIQQVAKALKTNSITLLKIRRPDGGFYYMTRDPMAYVLSLHFLTEKEPDWKSLDAFIVKQNSAYHNGTGESKLTDRQFDDWKEIYEKYERKWPLAGKTGAAPARSQEKVKLPQKMGSLVKVKNPDETFTWAKKNKIGQVVITPKIDGISILLTYANGKLKNAYTRGDGEYGKDITRHVMFVPDIPKTISIKEPYESRGELVMPQTKFNDIFSSQYANPRNMVAGVVNRSDSNSNELRHIKCFIYGVTVGKKLKSVSLNNAEKLGFKIVPFKVFNKIEPNDLRLQTLFDSWSKRLDFELDGLVIEADMPNVRSALGNETNSLDPKFARAFKPDRIDGMAKAKVLGIEWNVTRHKVLKPVVLIAPTKLAGVTVNRATGFNAAFVYKNKIGPGAIVELQRSGDVIPHILRVVKIAKAGVAQYPSVKKFGSLHEDYEWNDTEIDLVLKDGGDDLEDVRVQKTLHFFEKCGIERIKEETVHNLYHHGYMLIEDIVRMDKKDFMAIDRMGSTSADNILKQFEKLKAVPMHMLMYASNMFGKNFGSRKLKAITDKYGKNSLDWNGKSIKDIANEIAALPGFSYETGRQFAKGVMPFLKFYGKLKPFVRGVYPQAIKQTSAKLKGITVVFTGFRDKAIEDLIIENGGIVGSSISRNTNILLVSSKTFTSIKVTKARELGVKVMSADEFRAKYKI